MDVKKLFCKIGFHWMVRHKHCFTVDDEAHQDDVSGIHVYEAECACNQKWMVDNTWSLPLDPAPLEEFKESEEFKEDRKRRKRKI